MATFMYKEKKYDVDADQFLVEGTQWDDDFPEGMAPRLKIESGLSKEHWDVIRFIRNRTKETGRCPTVFETCRNNNLSRRELRRLFPTGYLRGACKLAGVTYAESFIGELAYSTDMVKDFQAIASSKTYKVDVRGFLIDPNEWDEKYAVHRAFDMKIPNGKLTERHWQVIHFLRESYKKNRQVPTVFEACDATNMELEELERLFPDGYHRGAVKVAGLRVK
jgi:tRNA 2-thiouridine synthesizing protein E